jgi:folate-dependent phosphoribosylglycinamide formyltransferase PurN
MRVLTPLFLNAFKHPDGYFRVINIHPSLLPDFPGASGYEDAFAAGVPESGITVHLVDEHVDHGPILAQARFQREPGDTIETFKARGLALEHQLFPRVLQQVSKEGIKLTVAR